MPELAEVEYFRRRWDAGLRAKILEVELRAEKRIFRGNDLDLLRRLLPGSRMVSSRAHGKQMLFGFSGGAWLGVHLGMTGQLRCEPAGVDPGRHDHLRLRQRDRTLVFSDPRLFGRVLFHAGASEPGWWRNLPPSLHSPLFTAERMREFLVRHGRAPLKAVLLSQEGFPGVGNWMADEILWRARLHPNRRAGGLTSPEQRLLWRALRFVCSGALKIVAPDYSDPPASWLFPHRWKSGGHCPRDRALLQRGTVGGRTSAWCPLCQPSTAGRMTSG